MLSPSDFNHNQQLPASSLLKFASDARWMAFATWPALAKMMQEDSGADVLVKAQLIRNLRPNRCTPASVIGVSQSPHAVGTTSLTLAYEFFDSEQEAFAQILTVCVRVKDGATLPLPGYVAEDLVWSHQTVGLDNTQDLTLLSSAIDSVKVPSVVANSNRLSHEVLVRPSDTDRRRIVNNIRMMQFFEDATAGRKIPDMIYFEILSELRAKTWCDILSVPNSENGGKDIISFLIDRESNKTMARSYMSWAAKVIQDGDQ